MKKLSSLLVLLLAVLSPFGARGDARVINVNDTGPGSLRAAIAAVTMDGGGTIGFDSSFNIPRTITLISRLEISQGLTIAGPGAGLLTVSGGRIVDVGGVVIVVGVPVFRISVPAAPPNVELSGLTIANGFNDSDGGGIDHSSGTLTISDCVVSGNTAAGGGGGVFSHGFGLNIRDSVIASNNASDAGAGGGVHLAGGELLLERCAVSGNKATDGNGAGLHVAALAKATLVDSTISFNTGAIQGGGLHNFGELSARQCTVAGNSCDSGGGGFYNKGKLTLEQCTVADNITISGGGGIHVEGGTFELVGTILAANRGAGGNFIKSGGSAFSLGYNLSDDTSADFLTATTDLNEVLSADLDPAGLQDNGGPTATIALLPGSPAIDAGDPFFSCAPPCYDQRGAGFPRVQGVRIDIGAVELGYRLAKVQVRDELIALRDTATSDLSKFNAAINYLNKSIDPANWLNDSHPKRGKVGESVFNNEKSAVSQVFGLQIKYPALTGLIDRLVNVDRNLALIAINDAKDAMPPGNTAKINAALSYLSKGDTDAAAGKPTNAIDDYKNAWKNAVAALP